MASRPASPGGLPTALSRFCGRRRELLQLRGLLATERLVTVTGAGGIGKTRLVTELARPGTFDFPDGVWFVDLARIERDDLVGAAIAEAVRAAGGGHLTPLERAVRVVAHGRQLLILDNCEHVAQGAAEAAWTLLTQCHALTVLATSRQPLHVQGERTWRLMPLRLPEQREAGEDPEALSEAVELFCDRASIGGQADGISAATAAAVTEICRRLDGMPLALELAAAWVPVLSPSQIAERLDGALADLSRDEVGRPARHRSIGASLEWSLRLLDPAQADAFARLSVFVGGFSLEGAVAVLGDGAAAVGLLEGLVARSLVNADTADDAARYRLLEPVRQYASERLRSRPGDADESCLRHLSFVAALAEAAANPIAGGPDRPWMRRLDIELGNIRAALAWGFARQPAMAARLAVSLLTYCTHRGLFEEGLAWAMQAATHSTGLTRGRALMMAGWYCAERGRTEAAAGHLTEAHRLIFEGGSSFDRVMVLHAESVAAYARGDLETMWELGALGLEVARTSGLDVDLMWALWAPAVCLSVKGEHRRALELFSESLAIAERLDCHSRLTALWTNVIDSAIDLGDLATASRHLEAALRDPGGEPPTVPYLVEAAAILAIWRGDPERGLKLFGAGRAALARLGYREAPDETERRRHWTDQARRGLSGEAADAAWEAGLALSIHDATSEAAAVVPAGPGDSDRLAPNSLAKEGEYWSVTYAGTVARVRDSKGLRDIARLLASAGRGVAAVDLIDAERPLQEGSGAAASARVGFGVEGDAGDVIDAAARAAYRARLAELEEDIGEADAANDAERAAQARIEREFLLKELRAAVGLSGRPRRLQDPAERARKAVTWRVRESISHIERVHPALGRHLRRAVRTGAICLYDPADPTAWRL